MGRKGMAKAVRTDFSKDAGISRVFLHQSSHTSGSESSSSQVDEKGRTLFDSSPSLDVSFQCLRGLGTHRDNPFLPSLPHDLDNPKAKVHSIQIQSNQFAYTYSTGVEKFKEGAVP